MGIEIQKPEIQRLVQLLAQRRGVSIEEAVKLACEEALLREPAVSLADRLKPLQDQIAALRRPGVVADKAFYDSLYED